MNNQPQTQKNNTPTLHEIPFVAEQVRKGALKGEYKDEEKIISWETKIKVSNIIQP